MQKIKGYFGQLVELLEKVESQEGIATVSQQNEVATLEQSISFYSSRIMFFGDK